MRMNQIYKILIYIIIGIVIYLAIISIVSAGWTLPKYTTCQMLNQTEKACDELWCSIIDCPYNETLEACYCVGVTNSDTFNRVEFLNETEVEKLIDTKIYHFNKTLNTTDIIIQQEESNESKLFQLRTDLESKIEDLEDDIKFSNLQNNFDISDINPMWFIFALMIIGGLIYMSRKKQTNLKKERVGNVGNSNEEAIKKAMELIKESHKQEKEK